jgi:long-chain acyl-CoA synthetase
MAGTADLTDEGAMIAAVLRHADSRPDDAAVTCGPATATWRELREQVLTIAGALPATGEGGRVALLGSASVGLVASYLGVIASGRCAVPLPVSAHVDALAGMLADCEPDLVFAHEEYLDLICAAYADRVITLAAGPEGALPQGFLGASAPLPEPRSAIPEAPFNIIYSSGTTGRAKGIVHSHAMRHRQAARSLFGIGPASTMLLATPLYSNTTLMPMLAALFHGGHVVLMPKFDAEAYLDLAETHRATHTMLVPVQYQRILATASFASRDLSAFEFKQCTGAPLQAATKSEIVSRWPGRFLEIYGLTEGGCTCILDATVHPDKAHTVGRPAAGNEIRVIDEEGRTLGPGERGEIVGRSATMMSGYFRNEAANAAFYWRDPDGTLFHRTGDIGMFDPDGFLVLLDRKKDLIISGGFNIYASDLEEKLLAHPDVAEAAVIAVPSEKWGETPLGLVVASEGAEVDANGLLEWVNARVGRTQRLSAVELRSALPRSNVGKVLKQDLRKPYWETMP